MATPFLQPGQPLLDDRFPLPLDRPFTSGTARGCGITSNDLTRLVRTGHLRRVVEDVYVAAQARDSLPLRMRAVALVVPPGAVVTDRTAAWLHGAEHALAPGSHLVIPPVSAFHRSRGCRLRREPVASGQRMMPDTDVMALDGLQVTTPLRTACDLGRLLHRDAAFASLDLMVRLGVDHEALLAATERFAGYRGIRQFRWMAPLADGAAESPPESVLRLRWLECGLPRPQLQIRVPGPWGGDHAYWLDLGNEELRYAVEYDGEEFHGGGRRSADRERRDWIRGQGWVVDVVRREDLFGPRKKLEALLEQGFRRARERLGRHQPGVEPRWRA